MGLSKTEPFLNTMLNSIIFPDSRLANYSINAINDIGRNHLRHLQTGKLVREALFKITIPEGLWHLQDIAAIIEKHTDYSKEEIVKKVRRS